MNVPEVGGDRLPCSIAEFEHKCKVCLGEEQRKIAPDNALISLICDAVRLSREFVSAVKRPHAEVRAEALESAASEWGTWTAITLRERAARIRQSGAEFGEKVDEV